MLTGHFIASDNRQVFVTQFGTPNPHKTLLLLPSLFEEMNLCRAIVAKQAAFLVEQGYCVYALDYAGTGDSQGDINQVTANDWHADILATVVWLTSQGVQSLSLWGIRFGGLIALTSLPKVVEILPVNRVLLWKPVPKGKQFMTQFLRLKQANSMMQGQTKINWREHILGGEETEVAGYIINAPLLASIDALEMPKELTHRTAIRWLELAATSVTPAIQIQTKQWPEAQFSVSCIQGSAFWQIPEIFAQPHLHQPTLNALQGKDADDNQLKANDNDKEAPL
ncbi:hypothetical protein GCM10009114_20940 [Aliiglaciecola litoralis]|uniref:Exosortase A system-associated hydrolase 2 n=2 Tax=Aliiglaciecola litoralis TaxID=582857 RepID=A0ABP3WYL2_9ALTE